MTPVGVVWERDVHKLRVTIVAKDRGRQGSRPRLKAQHAGEVRRLNHGIQIGHLRTCHVLIWVQSFCYNCISLQISEMETDGAERAPTWPGWLRRVSIRVKMA